MIVAQTNQLQQQTVLLNDITKQLMDPTLLNVEIIPTTTLATPGDVTIAALPDAVREALMHPDVKQAETLLKNSGIQVKTTRDAPLPVLTLFGQYESQGLGGNSDDDDGNADGICRGLERSAAHREWHSGVDRRAARLRRDAFGVQRGLDDEYGGSAIRCLACFTTTSRRTRWA